MELKAAMGALEKAGTAQNRKIYGRHGATGEMYGVSFAVQRKLQKQIKVDQRLAEQLWETGNVDARMLAAMVADPGAFTRSDLDRWMRDIDFYTLSDVFVREVVSKSPHVLSRMTKWMGAKNHWVARAGWVILAHVALADNDVDDGTFEDYVRQIEEEIHDAENLTRDAMNSALIAIGVRNSRLRKAATQAARRIGKVEVDHGETGCKTQDAVDYIDRTWARRN